MVLLLYLLQKGKKKIIWKKVPPFYWRDMSSIILHSNEIMCCMYSWRNISETITPTWFCTQYFVQHLDQIFSWYILWFQISWCEFCLRPQFMPHYCLMHAKILCHLIKTFNKEMGFVSNWQQKPSHVKIEIFPTIFL